MLVAPTVIGILSCFCFLNKRGNRRILTDNPTEGQLVWVTSASATIILTILMVDALLPQLYNFILIWDSQCVMLTWLHVSFLCNPFLFYYAVWVIQID